MPIAREALLLEILSQPTAPFRERHVMNVILRELESAEVPHFIDPVGNIVIGAKSAVEYRRLANARAGESPLRLFIAHMDHPGFHGAEWTSAGELKARWLGGSPLEHIEGASVWLAAKEGPLAEGKITGFELHSSGRALSSLTIAVPPPVRERYPDSTAIYGGFSFRAPVWKDGDLLRTKAADDLVGAFAILNLALDHWARPKTGGKSAKRRTVRKGAPPFLGLLTRAEEVGFIGAIGHFELGWLTKARRKILCVSLETSRQLPGAEIGKGPVVRLGDRFTVFHPGSLRVFTELAASTLPGRHQRKIMDGGTCEATAATAYGLDAIGISVPLGNYHNQSFEGGQDSRGPNGPAPEFVHLEDVAGLLTLCDALVKPVAKGAAVPGWDAPWKPKLKDFKKSLREHRALLRSGP